MSQSQRTSWREAWMNSVASHETPLPTSTPPSRFEDTNFNFAMTFGPLAAPAPVLRYTSYSGVQLGTKGALLSDGPSDFDCEDMTGSYPGRKATASWHATNTYLSFTILPPEPLELSLPQGEHHRPEGTAGDDGRWIAEYAVVYIQGNPTEVLGCLQTKDPKEMIISSLDHFPIYLDLLGEGQGMPMESHLRTAIPVTFTSLNVGELLRLVTELYDLENTGLGAIVRFNQRLDNSLTETQKVDCSIGARYHHVEFQCGDAKAGETGKGLFDPVELKEINDGICHGHHTLTVDFPLHLVSSSDEE